MKSLFSSAVSTALLQKMALTLAVLLGVSSMATMSAQAQSRPAHTPAPTSQNALVAAKGGKGSTCTSTNGQNTCVCQAKCEAKASNCSCYGVLPGSEKKTELSLATPAGPVKATCTSGDGKKVCPCGNIGCWAATANCGCLTSK